MHVLKGRFAWVLFVFTPVFTARARPDVDSVRYFYSIGLGGKGLVPTREHDTCGVGYYHLNLSNRLPAPFHSEQGVECYYNVEIAPWLHLTPDMRMIVNPDGTVENDVSLVCGGRLHMHV